MLDIGNLNDETLSRRERERLMHRQEIMDAAVELFATKGFFNTTLDEIAQKAQFSKGTLYLYFPSKEDLFYAILYENMHDIGEKVNDVFNQDMLFWDGLHVLFQRLADLSFEKRAIYEIAAAQHASGYTALSDEKKQEMNEMHNTFWGAFETWTKKAIERGELRDLPPAAVSGIIHGAIDHMMITKWFCENVDCLKHATGVFLDIMKNGMKQEKETEQ